MRIVCLYLYPIFKLGYLFSWYLAFWVLYMLDVRPLLDVQLVNYTVGCCFMWMTMSFAKYKPPSFIKSHLLTVNLSACAYSILFRKPFLMPMDSRLFPTCFFIRISVCCLLLRSFAHLELDIVQHVNYGSIWSLLHAAVQFDQQHFPV